MTGRRTTRVVPTNPDMRTIVAAYARHARTNRDAIARGDVYGLDIHTGTPLPTTRDMRRGPLNPRYAP